MPGRQTPDPLELSLPRWWEEHSEIDAMVADLSRMLAGGSLDRTLESFSKFRETVGAHFDAEETIYFPLIERLSAEEADSVRAATRGHDRIRASMDRMYEVLSDGDRQGARALLVELLDAFRVHETHEDALIDRLKGRAGTAA